MWPRKSHKFKGNIPTSSSGNSLLGHIFDPQYDGYLDTDHKQKSENTKHNALSAQICNFSNVFNTAKHVTAYRKFGLANFMQIQPYRECMLAIRNHKKQF